MFAQSQVLGRCSRKVVIVVIIIIVLITKIIKAPTLLVQSLFQLTLAESMLCANACLDTEGEQ